MRHQPNIFSILVPSLYAIFDEKLVPKYVVRDVASDCKVVAGMCSQSAIEGMMYRIAVDERA